MPPIVVPLSAQPAAPLLQAAASVKLLAQKRASDSAARAARCAAMPETCCDGCSRLCGAGVGIDRQSCLFCSVVPQLLRLWSIGSHNELLWSDIQPEIARLLAVLQNLSEHSASIRCLASQQVPGVSRQPRPSEEGDPLEAVEVLEEEEDPQ